MPEVGPNDVLIKIAQDRDLRHRHPHLQLGRVGAEDHPGADGRRPRVHAARSPRSAARSAASQVGERVSGEGHITCGHCRNCRAGRRHLCRNTVGVGVNRRARSPSTSCIPAFNVFKMPDDDPRRHRRDLRPARQRDAHRALVRPGRRGRADHRRRPDRHHGGGDRAARRRAPRGRSPTSTTTGSSSRRKMGATRVVNVAQRDARRRR